MRGLRAFDPDTAGSRIKATDGVEACRGHRKINTSRVGDGATERTLSAAGSHQTARPQMLATRSSTTRSDPNRGTLRTPMAMRASIGAPPSRSAQAQSPGDPPWSATGNDRFQETKTKTKTLLIHQQPNFVSPGPGRSPDLRPKRWVVAARQEAPHKLAPDPHGGYHMIPTHKDPPVGWSTWLPRSTSSSSTSR